MFVKFFVGVLQEVKQVGVVLVHDRPGFIKIFICISIMALSIVVLLLATGECIADIQQLVMPFSQDEKDLNSLL